MIKGVGDKSPVRVEAQRSGTERLTPSVKTADAEGGTAEARVQAPATPAAEMAAKGPPIDSTKVAEVKAAIAEGRYPVNPTLIARALLALGIDPTR